MPNETTETESQPEPTFDQCKQLVELLAVDFGYVDRMTEELGEPGLPYALQAICSQLSSLSSTVVFLGALAHGLMFGTDEVGPDVPPEIVELCRAAAGHGAAIRGGAGLAPLPKKMS